MKIETDIGLELDYFRIEYKRLRKLLSRIALETESHSLKIAQLIRAELKKKESKENE